MRWWNSGIVKILTPRIEDWLRAHRRTTAPSPDGEQRKRVEWLSGLLIHSVSECRY